MEHDRLTQYHRIAVRLKYLSGKEAPTPLELAEEMVAEIPEEIIADPKSTFLDPCAGIGTFGIALLKRLCKYHSEEHALSMIHLADVSRLKGKALERLGFKNIYVTDSLEKNWNMKFTIVIGNPPYQSESKSKGWVQWVKFVEKGMTLTTNELMYVTPNSWLGPGVSHDMVFSSLRKANLDCGKYFTVGSTFSWFCLSPNIDKSSNPVIVTGGEDHIVDRSSKWLSTDTTWWTIADKFFAGERFNFVRTTEHHTTNLKKWGDKNGKYELFHTHAQSHRSNVAPTRYSYEKYKVFLCLSGYSNAIVRKNIALTQTAIWMEVEENEVEGAQSVLNSKLYQGVLNSHKWSGWNCLDIIKDLPRVDLTRTWTDQELYDHFKLTEEEIKVVELKVSQLSHMKPSSKSELKVASSK